MSPAKLSLLIETTLPAATHPRFMPEEHNRHNPAAQSLGTARRQQFPTDQQTIPPAKVK